jgi:hypothetical protein
MDNLEVLLLPLGNVDVPLNKIVRCRWRDEEDYEDKVRDAVTRIGGDGWRYNLQGKRLDSVEDWIEYFLVFDPQTYPTRELAEVKAKTMPLDMIEQLVGHNRVAGCRQLGTWYIWAREEEGKRDVIPFVLKDVSKEEARRIYLNDNMKNDTQSAGWAIGNVRKMVPDLMSSGMARSQAIAILSRDMDLSVKAIERLAEIGRGLAAGIVSPAIKRLTPENAVEMWRLLVGHPVPVPFEAQKEMIDESFGSSNPRKSIGNYFSTLREALPPQMQVVIPKAPKRKQSPFEDAAKYLPKVFAAFQRAQDEDYEWTEEETLVIADLMSQINNAAPTVDLTEMIETQEANAKAYEVMAEEQQDEENNETNSTAASTAV